MSSHAPRPAATRLKTVVFDSPVGAWTLWMWEPAPELCHAVTGLWATSAQTVAFREKVIPRETVELMVNFGGHQLVHWPGRSVDPQSFRRAWVSGSRPNAWRSRVRARRSSWPRVCIQRTLAPCWALRVANCAGA